MDGRDFQWPRVDAWRLFRWAFYTHIASGPFPPVVGNDPCQPSFFERGFRDGIAVRDDSNFHVSCSWSFPAAYGWLSMPRPAPSRPRGWPCWPSRLGMCVALGWRSAVKRLFPAHRRWMLRGFLLLLGCRAPTDRRVGHGNRCHGHMGRSVGDIDELADTAKRPSN